MKVDLNHILRYQKNCLEIVNYYMARFDYLSLLLFNKMILNKISGIVAHLPIKHIIILWLSISLIFQKLNLAVRTNSKNSSERNIFSFVAELKLTFHSFLVVIPLPRIFPEHLSTSIVSSSSRGKVRIPFSNFLYFE